MFQNSKQNLTKRLVISGLIAAIYAATTIMLAPISYGPVQFRLSEILVLLAFIDPLFIGGLTLGCFLANIFGGLGLMDIIFGTFATFISCFAIYQTRRFLKDSKISLLIASLWPTIFNGIIIGFVLNVTINVPLILTGLQVAVGEFVVVTIVGVPLISLIFKKYNILNINTREIT